MSALLGPVHYWLYNKIQLQQAIVDELFSLGDRYGLNLEKECNQLYGTFENRPLEQVIDQSNIHGWLQERVAQVEYKYAYCITRLLDKDAEAMDSVKDTIAKSGINLAVTLKEFPLDAAAVYRTINDNLLDGMPCDQANRVLSQSDTEILWTRELCVHSRFWEDVGGDINIYYILRDVWIEALVEELGFLFDKPEANTYRIRAFGAD